jgi:hypothetical protein
VGVLMDALRTRNQYAAQAQADADVG